MRLHTSHPATALLRLGYLLTQSQRNRLETMQCNKCISNMNEHRGKLGEMQCQQ